MTKRKQTNAKPLLINIGEELIGLHERKIFQIVPPCFGQICNKAETK